MPSYKNNQTVIKSWYGCVHRWGSMLCGLFRHLICHKFQVVFRTKTFSAVKKPQDSNQPGPSPLSCQISRTIPQQQPANLPHSFILLIRFETSVLTIKFMFMFIPHSASIIFWGKIWMDSNIVFFRVWGLRLAMICGINFLIPSWSSQELVINDLDRYEVQVDDWHLGRLLHRFALPWELLSRSWLSGKPCCWNHRMQGILKYGEKKYFSTWRQWYLDHIFSGISDFSLPCSARRPLLHVAA